MRALTRTVLGVSGTAVTSVASERFVARRVRNGHHPDTAAPVGASTGAGT